MTLAGTFQGEQKVANVEKLLAQARAFEETGDGGLMAFVRKMLRRLESEPREAAAAIPAEGGGACQLMTIHQSKGLEFDAVFLPELHSPIPPNADSFIVRRKNKTGPIDAVTHYVGSELLPLLPPNIREMFAQSRQKDVAETLCVLYVAMTRAAQALHLFVRARNYRSGAEPWKAYAGMLLHALSDSPCPPPSSVLYESGTPTWYGNADGKRQSASAVVNTVVRQPIVLRPPKQAQVPSVAPSSLEGERKRRISDLMKASSDPTGAQYGNVLHLWFEQIEWLDLFLPRREELIALARAKTSGNISLEKAHDQFQLALRSPAGKSLLDKNRYAASTWWPEQGRRTKVEFEVRTEFPFALRQDDRIVRGNIDRLVLVRAGGKLIAAHVIDFKTDTFSGSSDLEGKVRYYRPQVDCYRQSIAQMFHLPLNAVRASLFFVHNPTTVDWQDEIDP